MHNWYADECPLLGLAAENGFFWRPDSKEKNEHKWIKPFKITDLYVPLDYNHSIVVG
jgi:hypothetical protein